MKESDLFEPTKKLLIEQLGCNDVYAEVANYDVLGLLNNLEIVVEMKLGMQFKLIEQAMQAVGAADYIFVAIPKPKSQINRVAINLLKQEGIGLIYVEREHATITFWGKRHRKTRRSIRHSVLPHHEMTVGGVKSGEGPTEYSMTIQEIKDFLRIRKRGNWVSVDELLDHVQTHYSNPKPSVMATLQQNWNQSWCETKVENRIRFFRYRVQ